MQGRRHRTDGGVEKFDDLPDVAPDEMPGFLGKVDGMDHVSVGFRGKSQYAFEVDLTYGDEIRLSTLKTLGQDLAARGFEKKTDFRPGESMSQVFMWDPYRHAEMKSDHE